MTPALGMELIFAGDYPDPTLLRVGSDYYMTHSGLPYAPALLIWHSHDLRKWTPVARALDQYDGDVWAPELVFHEGVFFIYYPTGGRNHVITAPSILGPWSKPIDLQIGHIDPGHIVGADGKRYLHLSGGHVVELAPDGLSARGEIRKVYNGWQIPGEWRIEGDCLESPKLIYRDGYYHMLVAQGGTAGPSTSHMIVHARSRTPVGPWENSPYNPIIRTHHRSEKWWSRGHGSLIDTPEGDWRIIYHAYENGYKTLGRQVLMEPVEWTGDGWLKVGMNGSLSGSVQPPQEQRRGLEASDDFSAKRLGFQWQFWSEYDPERYFFKNNSLVLRGNGTSPSDCAPLTCIGGDHAYEFSVDVDNEGEGEAGLLLFYNPSCYAGVSISKKGCRLGLRGQMMHFYYPAESQTMTLKIVNDHQEVEFWIGPVGGPLRKLPESADVSGYHHESFGGYLSLRPALFCSGNGLAAFRNFQYTKLP